MAEVKLHIGCGKRYLKGYVHIDINEFEHIDYRSNGRTLPMFQDNSVNLIYASHMLEYFDRLEVVDVLKEWHRVLKKGGTLRLAVPDFEALVKVYLKTKNLQLILGPMYGRWPLTDDTIIYHKTIYDFTSLDNVLSSVGFHNTHIWQWQDVFTGELEGYDDYSQAYFPHMDKKQGTLISLNVEAEK